MAATCMPLKAETKIVKNRNAKTLYITIPAVLAQDSVFPFKPGENVEVEIITKKDTDERLLTVRKVDIRKK